MKLLVMSDSHGHDEYVYSIISANRDSDYIIHLGDGEGDTNIAFSDIPNLKFKGFICVRGNCDYFSSAPLTAFENIGGYKFYITHGFTQNVKGGTYAVAADAAKNDRDVVLFGHTHTPFYKENDGIHLFNPGAVQGGSYGIITIEDDGAIKFEHKGI